MTNYFLAVLDDDGVLTGYESVPEATWNNPPPRRQQMHDRDLKPYAYQWTGQTFLPIPLGGEDEIRRRPRLLTAIVLALIEINRALPAGDKLPPQVAAVLTEAKRKLVRQ